VQAREALLAGAAAALKAPAAEIEARIAQLIEQAKAAEKEVSKLKARLAAGSLDDVLAAALFNIGDVKLVAARIDDADAAMLRDALDKAKERVGSGVVLLASVVDGKVALVAGVTKDLVGRFKAGEVVNVAAKEVGGKGGGRPDMAQAGGTDPTRLPEALLAARAYVEERVKAG